MSDEFYKACKSADDIKALGLISDYDQTTIYIHGRTALTVACRCGKSKIALELIRHRACLPHHIEQGGDTALLWACFKGLTQVAFELVNMGCDHTIKDDIGYDSFYYAYRHYTITQSSDRLRLLFLMRGCPNPTQVQLRRIAKHVGPPWSNPHQIAAYYEQISTYNNIFNDVLEIFDKHLRDSIELRTAFRKWVVHSRIRRIIPRGPDRIIYSYL
jgi:ankyrin repeat protein